MSNSAELAAAGRSGGATNPLHLVGGPALNGMRQLVEDKYDMVRVGLQRRPLTATAAVAWSGDLPSHIQQVLFDTADTVILEDERVVPRQPVRA